MTAIGLRNAAVESWEDHIEAWHHIGREVDGAAWARAAIAASVERHYKSDGIGRFAIEVGFSASSIREFGRTYEAFPENNDRSLNLTFTHHRHAVVFTSSTEEARAAVTRAEREGWSASALRRHLLPADMIANAVRRNVAEGSCSTGVCGPPSVDDKIFHISAMVESFYSVKDYEVAPLVSVGSKRSLKQLSKKIKDAVKWLEALDNAIRERTK